MRREFAAFERRAVVELSELAAVGEAAQAAVAEAGALAASPVRSSAPAAGELPAFGTCFVVVAPLPHHLVAVVFPFLRFAWRLPEWPFGRRASLLCAGGGRFAASTIR